MVKSYEFCEAKKKGMSSFVVMNVRKGKGSGGALGNHIDRTLGKEHMYKNANAEITKFNVSYNTAYKGTISERVNQRIEQGYKGKKAVRKDAVKYISLVLTGSHKKMTSMFKDQTQFKEWMSRNVEFLKEEYGKENIVKLDLHLDEKTPHFHAIIVPLTKDGRLSAKEVVGNKKAMQERLTRYAQKMESLGFERGHKMQKAKAKDINQFYNLVNETKKIQNIDVSHVKKISPRDKTQILEKMLKGEKMSEKIEEFNKGKGLSR